MKSLGEVLKESGIMEYLKQKTIQTRLQEEQSGGSQVSTTPETSYRCQTCQDEEGYFVKRPVEMFVEGKNVVYMMDHWQDCECKHARFIERTFKSSKITTEFQNKGFDNFFLPGRPSIVTGAFQSARAYVQHFDQVKHERSNSIALLGRPGCGKTHLLMAVSNELIRKGVQVLYFPWVEGFNEIKDDLSLTEERVNRMQKVDVLYIDDMWKGRKEPTPFQIEQCFAVINYRYLEKKPILVSSEKDIDAMCDIDEGIGSRINEMCKDFRVILKGDKTLNYRLSEGA